MPRNYNNKLATKRYVNQRIEEEQWSRQYICTGNFDEAVSDYSVYNLTEFILLQMTGEGILNDAPVDSLTDGEKVHAMEYKVDYIKLHFRAALGESETVSAISQTIRIILYRYNEQYRTCEDVGIVQITEDLDGALAYDSMYGNKFGLYWDKSKYVHSWSVDTDTTAGGQVFFNKFVKPKITDTVSCKTPANTVPSLALTDTEKGCILMAVFADDPDGTNAQLYGYCEIGWRYKY